jgi:hypothetical protein
VGRGELDLRQRRGRFSHDHDHFCDHASPHSDEKRRLSRVTARGKSPGPSEPRAQWRTDQAQPGGARPGEVFRECHPVIPRTPQSGAGGNRTPVHQPVNEPDTTIPDSEPDAGSPAGRLIPKNQRPGFPGCQSSFRPSAVFLAVVPRFCCRAAVEWPRAASLLTIFHYQLINQARAKLLLFVLAIVFVCPV